MSFTRSILSFDDWTAVSQNATLVEFDWIGIDSLGQFGVFSSVTVGYKPPKVFSSYELYAGLFNFLLDHQISTTAQIISKEPGAKNFWRDWAQKGLFAYDYDDFHRKEKFDRYDFIAIPDRALLITEIPEIKAFSEIIPRFKFAFDGNISFSQLKGYQ